MIRLYAAAIDARLRADEMLTHATFEGTITDRPESYCSYFLNGGRRRAGRFNSPPLDADFTITVHSVGTTIDQAHLIQEHVIGQLLGFTPVVEGRTTRRLKHEVSRSPIEDRDPTPSLWVAVDQFDFTSEPAPSTP